MHRIKRDIEELSQDILRTGLQAHCGEPDGKLFTFAESCTGGLLASCVTGVAGISAIFPGSLVTYSNLSKIEQLNVTPETLRDFGAVSGECAAEMAYGALRRFDTKIAVSVTGIAGPDGGTPDKPVGTVWFALALHDGRMRLRRGYYKNKERRAVQMCATRSAMELILLGLTDL